MFSEVCCRPMNTNPTHGQRITCLENIISVKRINSVYWRLGTISIWLGGTRCIDIDRTSDFMFARILKIGFCCCSGIRGGNLRIVIDRITDSGR